MFAIGSACFSGAARTIALLVFVLPALPPPDATTFATDSGDDADAIAEGAPCFDARSETPAPTTARRTDAEAT